MDNFQEVFYLKSAIISKPVLIETVEAIERDAIVSTALETMKTLSIEIPQPEFSVEVHSIKEIPAFNPTKTYRLRKRQHLAAWIQENKIDLSIYRVEVSNQGVISLNEL